MKTIILHSRKDLLKKTKSVIQKRGVIFSPVKKFINKPINQAPLESGTKKNKEGTAEILHQSLLGGFERL